MLRKIIKQGHNTLTVTLPREWVKKFNLKQGDEISISERDNGLFVSSEKKDVELETSFNIEGMDVPTIWKYIMGVYREGYDKVTIKFNPNSTIENPYKFYSTHRLDPSIHQKKLLMIEALQNFIDRFIGFEIIDHGNDYVVVKDIGGLSSKEFDNTLRRIFLILKEMSEKTLEALEKSDPSKLMDTHIIDIHLDKFHDYCIRVLNKIGNKDNKKTSLLFSTLYLMEMMGDQFKNISIHLINDFSKAKFDNIKKFAQLVMEEINEYYELFYKFDVKRINKISSIDQEIYMDIPKVYKKADENEKEIFHHLRVIETYINSLTELRIEMEF